MTDEIPKNSLLDDDAKLQVATLTTQVDLVYGKMVRVVGDKKLTAQNVIPVVVELMKQCNAFTLRGNQKKLVVLTCIQKFCDEHASDSVEFAMVVPLIDVLVDVAKGYVNFDFKKAVKGCC